MISYFVSYLGNVIFNSFFVNKEEIIKNKEYVFNKLKFSTKYYVKVQLVVESFNEFGKDMLAMDENRCDHTFLQTQGEKILHS